MCLLSSPVCSDQELKVFHELVEVADRRHLGVDVDLAVSWTQRYSNAAVGEKG